MTKTIIVEVTTSVTIEVDLDDDIVKEYASENELIGDLVGYNFGTVLPVVQMGGVKVLDTENIDYSY